MSDDRRAPVGRVDVTTLAFAQDPLPGYDILRTETPVSWQPAVRGLLLTRFDDVEEAYRNTDLHELDLANPWRKIAAKLGTDYSAALRIFEHLPFVHEGPRHQALRSAIARAIAPASGDDTLFRAVIARKLAAVRPGQRFDIAKDFANTLFFDTMCELLTLPADLRTTILPMANVGWGLDSTLAIRDRERLNTILATCIEALLDYIPALLERGDNPLARRLVEAAPPDQDPKAFAATLIVTMLVMGNDAISGCITFPLRAMLDATDRHLPQARWGELSDDAIRFASTVTYSTRTASAATTVAGCPVKAKDVVMLSVLAANHDPDAVGAEPATVRPRPDVAMGLAFGIGPHSCVGKRISQALVRCAFEAFAGLPPMRRAGPVVFGKGRAVRAIDSLPVTFEQA